MSLLQPSPGWKRLALLLLVTGLALGCSRTRRVDPTEPVFEDFALRVNRYVAVHKAVADSVGPLDESASQQVIAARATRLANGIMAARDSAKPGEIFAPEVQALFATLIQEEYKRRPAPVQDSREDAQEELPDFVPHVNEPYPTTYPLATFPATLLRVLPQLPPEVEYRIVSHFLILRDVEANLIVDVMPDAVP